VADGYSSLYGETVQVEAPTFAIPTGETYCDLYLYVRPVSGLSDGVSVDFEIMEMGLFPVSLVTH